MGEPPPGTNKQALVVGRARSWCTPRERLGELGPAGASPPVPPGPVPPASVLPHPGGPGRKAHPTF